MSETISSVTPSLSADGSTGSSPKITYKYSERANLIKISNYIDRTYTAHYAGMQGTQLMDLAMDEQWGEGFVQGNIIKYASRANRKGSAVQDIYKVIHYALLWLHMKEQQEKNNTGETK